MCTCARACARVVTIENLIEMLSATDAVRGNKLDRQLEQLERDLSLALPQSALERQIKALEALAGTNSQKSAL